MKSFKGKLKLVHPTDLKKSKKEGLCILISKEKKSKKILESKDVEYRIATRRLDSYRTTGYEYFTSTGTIPNENAEELYDGIIFVDDIKLNFIKTKRKNNAKRT